MRKAHSFSMPIQMRYPGDVSAILLSVICACFGFRISIFEFGHLALVVMIGGPKILGARKFTDELGRVVNEDRQMLRADPGSCAAVFQRDQRRGIGIAPACETSGYGLVFGHQLSSVLQYCLRYGAVV